VIETLRLRLEPLTMPAAQAIVARRREGRPWHEEFPTGDDQDAAAMVAELGETRFGCRVIVEKHSGLVVGTIGFTGPPDGTGTVTVGYGLVPSARGRGYATEALCDLVAYAFTQPSVRAVTADSLHDNVASHRVLEKAGFSRTHATEDTVWFAIRNDH